MKIGITGASGHVGNVLCRLLLEQGYDVRAMYHQDKRSFEDISKNPKLELLQGDVLDPVFINKFVSGCDIIVNSAAIISIHGDPSGIVYRTNTEGPKNITDACSSAGVKKLIHLSSTHAVMETPLSEPFDETRPYKQKGAYAYDFSKATGEQIVLNAIKDGRLSGLVLRPSSVIGPFDFKPSEIGKALIDFYNQNIPVLPPGGYNFVDVRDVAETILKSFDQGKNGEVYLVSGKYYTLKEFAKIVKKASGKKIPSIVLPFWFLHLLLPFMQLYGKISGAAPIFTIEAIKALKNGHPRMNNDKAREHLGHRCRPLSESIGDFYKWNQEHGVLK